ncbi:hypothetical protein [Acidilutibacter cellobiosedens]|jgi:hypothetical protein|nr:hypothetical protein [Acidilutibacter cellobiosedens]
MEWIKKPTQADPMDNCVLYVGFGCPEHDEACVIYLCACKYCMINY